VRCRAPGDERRVENGTRSTVHQKEAAGLPSVYKLDVAVGSPSMQESRENISTLEIAGLWTSANDLMSSFYDSSS
jgi:hypothetical protein